MKTKMLCKPAFGRRRLTVLFAAGMAACPAIARATVYAWNGSTTSGLGYLSQNDNWIGNVAPPANGISDLVFGSINTHGYQPTASMAYTINSIAFNSSALSYYNSTSIAGGFTLSVAGGGVSDFATANESIGMPIAVLITQPWNVSTGLLSVNSVSMVASSTLTVNTSSGSATASFNGPITGASGSTLTKVGPGTMTLTGVNTLSQLNVQGGNTQMSSGSSLVLSSSAYFSVTGGTLNVSNAALDASQSTGTLPIDGPTGTAMTVAGSNAIFRAPAFVNIGAVNHGTLTLQQSANASIGSTTLEVGGASGAVGALNILSGSNASTGFLDLGDSAGSIGTATVDGANSKLTITTQLGIGGGNTAGGTGTFTVSNNASVTAPLTVFWTNTSTLNISGGSFTTTGLITASTGPGSINLVDPSLGGAGLTINASTGSPSFTGPINGTGSITKLGASMQTLTGQVTIGGIANVSGGILSLGGSGDSVGALLVQNANVTIPSGSLAIKTSTLSPFQVLSGSTLNISGGAIVDSTSGHSGFSSVVDGPAGTGVSITGTGSQFNLSAGLVVGGSAQGFFNVTSGAVATTSGLFNVGLNNGSKGSILVSGGSSFTDSGGGAVLGQAVGAAGLLTVTGSLSGFTLAGPLSLGGNNAAGGTGTLNVSNAATVQTGPINFNSNTSTATVSVSRLNTTGLTSFNTGYGAISLSDPGINNYALAISDTSSTSNYSGSITGTGSIIKTGTSTQILSGSNTFTGTCVDNGGTLNLSSGTAASYVAQNIATPVTMILNFGNFGTSALSSYTGATIIINTPLVNGGSLQGNGNFNISSVSNFIGTSIANGVNLTLANNAGFSSVTSAGNISNPASSVFSWFGGSNAGGNVNISGSTYLSGFTSSGVLQVTNVGQISDYYTNLVLLGGSRTYVGTSNAPGGVIALATSGTTIELDGGLLVNYGNISGGTLNINYGGLATGTGIFPSVVVGPGGTYLPGPYGAGSPNIVLGSPNANIQPASSGTTSTSTSISAGAPVVFTVNGADSLTLTNPLITNGNSVTKVGAGSVTLAPFTTPSLNVSAGTMQISPATSPLQTGTLMVSTGAQLDIQNGSADISSTSLGTVNVLVRSAFAGGTWNGSGLTSKFAASDSTHLTAVGVIQNNQSGTALFTASHLFEGTVPGVADVLAKYTYFGDTNLDGKVDGSDYSRIDSGFLTHSTGWFNGDFNYDGVINGSDYTLIDNAFNTQGASLASLIAPPRAIETAQIAGSSAVPEPATLALIGAGSLAFLLGRKRTAVHLGNRN